MEATTDDVLDELAEEKKRAEKIQAEQIARERREAAAYRARVTAEAAELRGRLNESLDELGDLVPRLLLACAHFDTIAAEVQVKGLGPNPGAQMLEDIYCIPPTFGRDLCEAIKTLSPRTEWDYSHIGSHLLGKVTKAARPKLKEPLTLRVPRFAGDRSPPFGFSGTWDPIKGEPIL